MSIQIVACLIKRHGSLLYKKQMLSFSRQFICPSGKLQKEKINTLISPVIEKSPGDKNSSQLHSVKQKSAACRNPILKKKVEHTNITTITKDDPKIYIDSLRHTVIPKDSLPQKINISSLKSQIQKKPEKDITSLKSQIQEIHEKDISLLNVIQPKNLDWYKQIIQPQLLLKHYMALSKIRLTGLVVLTTVAGYGMACAPFEPLTFTFSLVGTALLSSAANTVNQILEVPYDSQMARTKNRVLIKGMLTPLHAAIFAACTSTAGLSVLYFGVNGLTASLGITNLLLYTSIYTPMKRYSILNTWVGSIVGAIPPLMGWAACSGSISTGALVMAAILYSWQFPHFNALSWNLRSEYSRAGYRMMSAVNPDLCRKTAFRHSVAIFIFCNAAPLLDLTTWSFPIDSLPFNLYFMYCAHKFYKNGDSQSSRHLFRLSLVYLPALMILMYIGRRQAQTNSSTNLVKL